MKISGHSTNAVFKRYDIASERDLQEAVIKTSAYVESLPSNRTVTPISNAEK